MDPHPGWRAISEDRPLLVRTLEEGQAQKQRELVVCAGEPGANEPLGRVIWWVGDDVVGAADGVEEVVAGFSISPSDEIGADDRVTGQLEHLRHAAVAACAPPDRALKLLVIDQRVGRPGQRRVEVRSVEILEPFDGGREGAVEVVCFVQ